METCFGAFSKMMALVVPGDEEQRSTFFPFLVGTKLPYKVVFWTHNLRKIPGPSTVAHCVVNLPDIIALQKSLNQTAPELHRQAVVTVSLRALKFQLLITTGPNALSSAVPDKTQVLPYTRVCREIAPNNNQWRWSMSKRDGCAHGTYQNLWMASLHDASDKYFTNFSTDIALFDMAYDDYHGVCGSKHPLSRAIVRGLNMSNFVH